MLVYTRVVANELQKAGYKGVHMNFKKKNIIVIEI